MRLPPLELGMAIGATLIAPLTATLVLNHQQAPQSTSLLDAAVGWRASSSVVALDGAAAGGNWEERLVSAADVGKASSEALRTHAAHTLLHYVRRLEAGETPAAEESQHDGLARSGPTSGGEIPSEMISDAAATRSALLSFTGVLLPLAREALDAARFSSVPELEPTTSEASQTRAAPLAARRRRCVPLWRSAAIAFRASLAAPPSVGVDCVGSPHHRARLPSSADDLFARRRDRDGAVGPSPRMRPSHAQWSAPHCAASLAAWLCGDATSSSSLGCFGHSHTSRLTGRSLGRRALRIMRAHPLRGSGIAGLIIDELPRESSRCSMAPHEGPTSPMPPASPHAPSPSRARPQSLGMGRARGAGEAAPE